jgi:hypothetical protein
MGHEEASHVMRPWNTVQEDTASTGTTTNHTIFLWEEPSTWVGSKDLGFDTGIPRVGFCHTVTEPPDTVPVQGTGRNRPLIYAVSYETRGIMDTRGYFVMQTTKSLLQSITCILAQLSNYLDVRRFPLPLRTPFHSRQNIFEQN